MLEILLCSLVTILPDYLIRRYVQGRRIGHEITLFSVWYELRWGIVGCVILAVMLITAVFYFHPSTSYVTAVFRTVPIVSEGIGRVEAVYVRGSERVEAGQPLFRLAAATQATAVERARREVAEVDAAFASAEADLRQAEARLLEAQWSLQQVVDELEAKAELARSEAAARREVERLVVLVRVRESAVAAADAAREAVQARIAQQIPAQRASAEAVLAQAEAELAKTVVRAGVAGRVEQFAVQVGDIVNPVLRPAGVLVPEDRGFRRIALAAGFGQVEAQVVRPGLLAEATCASKPWVVIPMVVTQVQGFIATGQVRPTDQLIDPAQFRQPGTVLAVLEPLYAGGLDGVMPGSSCLANVYTSNHERLADPSLGAGQRIALHAVDATGFVHAILLRIQAVLLPFRTLVLSGGH
jgi:multidrug resistance efflux pump